MKIKLQCYHLNFLELETLSKIKIKINLKNLIKLWNF